VARIEGDFVFVDQGLNPGDTVILTRLIDPLENALLDIAGSAAAEEPIMKRVLAAFARNTVFANIVLVLIFIAGYIATSNMIRETFPEFSLDMITIAVPYPGADPEEVEEGISRKIEEAIEGLQGIKQYTTQSSEGTGDGQYRGPGRLRCGRGARPGAHQGQRHFHLPGGCRKTGDQ
jgi:hypothetical protein